MPLIQLTQGQFAKVDECDAHLSKWKWCACFMQSTKTFYAGRSVITKVGRRFVFLHHAIIGRPLKKGVVVDHINGDTLDNRRENLRLITHRENCCNTRLKRSGHRSSKFPGVTWEKRRNAWIANIQTNKKRTYLGQFKNESDAYLAYKAAADRSEQ